MITVDMVELRAFVQERMNMHTTLTDEKIAEIAMQATWDYLAPLIRDSEEYAVRIAVQATCNIFKQIQETDQ